VRVTLHAFAIGPRGPLSVEPSPRETQSDVSVVFVEVTRLVERDDREDRRRAVDRETPIARAASLSK